MENFNITGTVRRLGEEVNRAIHPIELRTYQNFLQFYNIDFATKSGNPVEVVTIVDERENPKGFMIHPSIDDRLEGDIEVLNGLHAVSEKPFYTHAKDGGINVYVHRKPMPFVVEGEIKPADPAKTSLIAREDLFRILSELPIYIKSKSPRKRSKVRVHYQTEGDSVKNVIISPENDSKIIYEAGIRNLMLNGATNVQHKGRTVQFTFTDSNDNQYGFYIVREGPDYKAPDMPDVDAAIEKFMIQDEI